VYYGKIQAETRVSGKAVEERRQDKVFLFYTKVIYKRETCTVHHKVFRWVTDKEIVRQWIVKGKERDMDRITSRLRDCERWQRRVAHQCWYTIILLSLTTDLVQPPKNTWLIFL